MRRRRRRRRRRRVVQSENCNTHGVPILKSSTTPLIWKIAPRNVWWCYMNAHVSTYVFRFSLSYMAKEMQCHKHVNHVILCSHTSTNVLNLLQSFWKLLTADWEMSCSECNVAILVAILNIYIISSTPAEINWTSTCKVQPPPTK